MNSFFKKTKKSNKVGEKMRESFVFYKNFYETIKILPKRQFSIMIEAIVEYGLYNKLPNNLSLTLQALFKNFKDSIDKAQRRYDASVENGKCGGAPKGNKNAKKLVEKQPKSTQNNLEQPKLTENNLNEDDNENVNDNESEDENMLGCFSPTLAEIISYAKSELKIEDKEYCEKFYNHYSGIGWVNGSGRPIVDWQSVFKNWIKKDKKSSKNKVSQVGSTKGLPKL